MSQPPAAWHPDPDVPNQLRWWDGSRWTDATAPAPTNLPTPGPSPAAAPAPTTPPAPKKRHTGWRIVGIIFGALVLGGLLSRLSTVALVLLVIAASGVGFFVLVARPIPALGLRRRTSGLAALGVAALVLMGSGMAGASTSGSNRPTASDPQPFASPSSPTPTPTPTTFDTATEEVVIPFDATTIDDPLSDQGTTTVVTAGVNGVKVITYRLTLVDGVEVLREVVSEVVQTAPVSEVTAIGSKVPTLVTAPAPLVQQGGGGCDPNYTGACVPIASDVDCAGGSGNGPAYVQGPVRVVGTDIYDLDRDGDGIACD